MDKNYLQHYGVLGMRWGVRRYENKDGSLTELGKKHYGTKENYKQKTSEYDNYWTTPQNNGKDKPKASRQEQVFGKTRNAAESARDIARTRAKYSKKPSHPELKGMSNKEIQDAITRMDLERRYSSLKDGDFKSGWEKASDILEVAGNIMSIATAAAGVYMIIKNQPELLPKIK